MKFKLYNYLVKTTHHAKFHFGTTMWMVSVQRIPSLPLSLKRSFLGFMFPQVVQRHWLGEVG